MRNEVFSVFENMRYSTEDEQCAYDEMLKRRSVPLREYVEGVYVRQLTQEDFEGFFFDLYQGDAVHYVTVEWDIATADVSVDVTINLDDGTTADVSDFFTLSDFVVDVYDFSDDDIDHMWRRFMFKKFGNEYSYDALFAL